MKKLSLSEFRDYCGALSYGKIIFSTDNNQSWNSVDSTISTELEFNNMLITFNPNVIYLKDRNNSMRFKKVKAIKLHEEDCILGKVFTVVCGDLHTKSNDKEYTLIAQ